MSAPPAIDNSAEWGGGCGRPGSGRGLSGRRPRPPADRLRIPRRAFESRWDGWLGNDGATIRLGAGTCEVVVTSASVNARAAVASLGRIQAGAGGPVIVVDGWLAWLVPPGTTRRWPPHPYGLCFGAGVVFDVPPRDRTTGPGTYWLRPPRTCFVDPRLLWRVLSRFKPDPSPHGVSLLDRWPGRR